MSLQIDKRLRGSSDDPSRSNVLASLLRTGGFTGRSFNHGLLRFHNAETAAKIDENLAAVLDLKVADTTPIGYDWLGRQLVAVEKDGESVVLLVDPARAMYDELCTVPQFFTILSHEDIAEVFSGTAFEMWRESEAAKRRNGVSAEDVEMAFDECLAFVQPLYDGGEDALENTRVENVAEYWERITQ